MEIRSLKGIVIEIYSDDLMKISYARFLSQALESIKLPTNLENYKYRHLLRPNYLLEIEIVKTRKNWILKNVLGYKEITRPEDFNEFLKLSEMIKILQSSVKENQETKALPYYVNFLYQKDLQQLQISEFEKGLMQVLGFSD